MPTPSPPNPAVRRFAAVQALSLAIKIAALVVLAVVVLHFLGGP